MPLNYRLSPCKCYSSSDQYNYYIILEYDLIPIFPVCNQEQLLGVG